MFYLIATLTLAIAVLFGILMAIKVDKHYD